MISAPAYSASNNGRATIGLALTCRTVRSAITAAILFGFASASNAAQPPDVVQSDASQNTAAGTAALLNLIYEATPTGIEAFGNTAVGFHALTANLGGYSDTAVGNLALANTITHDNTGVGDNALASNTYGEYNTGIGSYVLVANTTGSANTASGYYALAGNSTGQSNSAFGAAALQNNSVGSGNTAVGYGALEGQFQITTGSNNTAIGIGALSSFTTASNNTASGYEALDSITTGNDNAASGYQALAANTTGSNNEASGANALHSNTIGNLNTASGENSLYSNVFGSSNSGFGHSALKYSTGTNNLGLGANGGYNVTGGSNNIEIANQGLAGDNGVIRIGAPTTQTATFIAGIENSKVTGAAVYVTPSGQLGVLASSERYKTAIANMGTTTEKLQKLRPVSFHLKSNPTGEVQYGLIAEEVAKVYPELVIRDAAGAVQGVRYDELAPMLLNEMQIQRSQMTRQIDSQAARIASLEQQLADIQVALAGLQNRDQRVAQR